jgi:hypothetical protein
VLACLVAEVYDAVDQTVNENGANATAASEAARESVQPSELGLRPAPPPEPLPSITGDDIHLICWIAIVPDALELSGRALT